MIKLLVSWSSHSRTNDIIPALHCKLVYERENYHGASEADTWVLRSYLEPEAAHQGVRVMTTPRKEPLPAAGSESRPCAPRAAAARAPPSPASPTGVPGGEPRRGPPGRPRGGLRAGRGARGAGLRDTHLRGHEGRCALAGLPVAAEAGGRAGRWGGARRGRGRGPAQDGAEAATGRLLASCSDRSRSVSARQPAPHRVPGPAARTSRLRSARGGGGAAGRGGTTGRAGARGRVPGGGARRPGPPRRPAPPLAQLGGHRLGLGVGAAARGGEGRGRRGPSGLLVPPPRKGRLGCEVCSPAGRVLCARDGGGAEGVRGRALAIEGRAPRAVRAAARRCCRRGQSRGALGCGARGWAALGCAGEGAPSCDRLWILLLGAGGPGWTCCISSASPVPPPHWLIKAPLFSVV